MHLIVLIVFVPLLAGAVFSVTVMLPFSLVMEGIANNMPGPVVAGILVFVVIWGWHLRRLCPLRRRTWQARSPCSSSSS